MKKCLNMGAHKLDNGNAKGSLSTGSGGSKA